MIPLLMLKSRERVLREDCVNGRTVNLHHIYPLPTVEGARFHPTIDEITNLRGVNQTKTPPTTKEMTEMKVEAIEADPVVETVGIPDVRPQIRVHLGVSEGVESRLLNRVTTTIRARAQSQTMTILQALLADLRKGKLRYLMDK